MSSETPIQFLDLDDVLLIHADVIREFGGDAGIRDRGLIESAVSQPQASSGGEYLHGDVFEMAAALTFSQCGYHGFVDGNKRVAAMAAFAFLGLNGHDLDASERDFENLIWRVARGEASKDDVAAFYRTQCSKS